MRTQNNVFWKRQRNKRICSDQKRKTELNMVKSEINLKKATAVSIAKAWANWHHNGYHWNSLQPGISHSDINCDCCCFALIIQKVTLIYQVANWIQHLVIAKLPAEWKTLYFISRWSTDVMALHFSVHPKGTAICLLQEMFIILCILCSIIKECISCLNRCRHLAFFTIGCIFTNCNQLILLRPTSLP